MTAARPMSVSINRQSPIMVSLLPPFRFSAIHLLTSSGRFVTGVASTGRHLPQRYSRFQPLLIHPSSTIFQLQMFLQPSKRRWRKSSKDSYQPVRRESVVVVSGHGSTQNAGPCVATREARRLERLYRRTRAPADRVSWVKYVRAMHRTYRDREREHWEARIAAHSEQPKRLWATFNALLGRVRADRSSNPTFLTAENYVASFQAKVQTIRDDTAGSPPPTFPSKTCILSAVMAITPAELRHIIIAAAPKSCELEPLPTFLLQEHLDILLPLLTTICNRSILEGVMPLDQKRSILVPVIKRVGLDPTDPGNFRPIANVSFISKVIEKIIAYQLVPYLEANNLIPAIQSGFRKGHSKETLLLRLLSDIYGAIDRSQLTLLALFDVSAAFDTVDHEILLERLQISFGVTGAFSLLVKIIPWGVLLLCGTWVNQVPMGSRPIWPTSGFRLGPPTLPHLHFRPCYSS